MPFVPLMRQFYQALNFVVVCQAPSTTPVNKTTADGKVFICGDHNEVILYTSQETKKALAEIKSELNSLNERNKKFAERILSLGKHTERKLDLMNKSNAGLFRAGSGDGPEINNFGKTRYSCCIILLSERLRLLTRILIC